MRRTPQPCTLDLLAGLALFRGVDLTPLSGLLSDCEVVELDAGEVLLEPGQDNTVLYSLLSGRLEVHLDDPLERPIAHIEAGECVGELSIIDDKRVSARVVAAASSLLVVLPREVLWALVDGSGVVARNLLYVLTSRVRSSNAMISEVNHLQQDYQHQAHHDPLTGLYNRWWLEEALKTRVQRATTSKKPLCLLIIDVDNFKQYNDSHGHQAGDRALIRVAEALERNLRPGDAAARYGGDELVVFLTDTAAKQGRRIAQRLCEAIRATPITASDGAPLPHVSASIGIAELSVGSTAEQLFGAADRALYWSSWKAATASRVEPAGRIP